MAISKVVFLAALAIVAFSLQGCGDNTGGDNKAEYKSSAATAKAEEEAVAEKTKTENDDHDTPADEVQEKGGCPAFQAAVKAESAQEDMMDKILEELKAEAECVKDIKSAECAAGISQNVADNIMFTVEKDHEFVAWTKKEENKAKWDKVKDGSINQQLLEVFSAVVVTLQGKLPADATLESVTTQPVLDTPTWLRVQLTQAVTATVEAFCPAYDEQVDSAVTEAEPFAEAAVDAEQAESDAQIKATKEENDVEALTTLAPDVAAQAAESKASDADVMKSAVTQTEAENTATATADGN